MGDKTAYFNGMVERNRRFLNSRALRFVQDEEKAKDIVQDTLVKAWRSIHKFKEGTSERAWLGTILKNVFFDVCRSKTNRNGKITGDIEKARRVSVQADAESGLSLGNIHSVIGDLKRTLGKDRQKSFEAFLLRLDGYKYDEIAEIQSVPLGTVKAQIHRVKQELKAVLARDGTLLKELSRG